MDGKATRDPNDPFRRLRGDDEARLERIVLRGLHAQLREIMARLGDPPSPNALDYALWETLQNTMIADVRPELERMALHLARGEAKAWATKAEPILPTGIPVLWEEEVIFREAADWARQYTYELVRGISETTQAGLRAQLAAFVQTPGMTTGQLRDSISALFGQSRAQRIAVTETTRAYAEGTRMVQEEIAKAGIRMEQVWRTSMDDRVCPICGPNADKRKSEGWTVSGVPAHPNCRCWTVLQMEGPATVAARPVWREYDEIDASGVLRARKIVQPEETLAEAEDAIRFGQYETAYLYDEAGNALWGKSSFEKHFVAFTDQELAEFRGRILTHNHPGSTAFSSDDIQVAISSGLRQMRITSYEYAYTLDLPDGAMWSQSIWDEIAQRVSGEQILKARAGLITRRQMAVEGQHLIVKEMAAHMRWAYSRRAL